MDTSAMAASAIAASAMNTEVSFNEEKVDVTSTFREAEQGFAVLSFSTDSTTADLNTPTKANNLETPEQNTPSILQKRKRRKSKHAMNSSRHNEASESHDLALEVTPTASTKINGGLQVPTINTGQLLGIQLLNDTVLMNSEQTSGGSATPTMADYLHAEKMKKELIREVKIINCNIHGRISISHLAEKIMDNEKFQKIGDQAQLAFCQRVYPTATHTRKAHSIGVYYLVKKMMHNLRRNATRTDVEKKGISGGLKYINEKFGIPMVFSHFLCEIVAIAGLVHDVGHGPFCHAFELIIKQRNITSKWKDHEVRSGDILELILKQQLTLSQYSLMERYILFMKDLIIGEVDEGKQCFLYQLVSNELNGFDCDKYDYIQRDSRGLGIPISFDPSLMLKSPMVVEGDVCYPYQEHRQLYELSHSRERLFQDAYAHRAVLTINEMSKDAMSFLPNLDELFTAIQNGDMDTFCKYTDDRLEVMLADDTGKAGEIWKRIRTYNLYHALERVRKSTTEMTKDEFENFAKKTFFEQCLQKYPMLDASQCFVKIEKIGYLSGNRTNPLLNLPIYKTDYNTGMKKRYRMTKDDITTLLPANHQEYYALFISKEERANKCSLSNHSSVPSTPSSRSSYDSAYEESSSSSDPDTED
jgi:HD superfamily phosphohydrolase